MMLLHFAVVTDVSASESIAFFCNIYFSFFVIIYIVLCFSLLYFSKFFHLSSLL